ncbi:hypothetical protein [Paracidovorax wautersii]|uniref:Thiol:disulfide interchange protein DsbG n=1 Tax=Paracidovorax wautersii TaxID=1177982 RepID=A0A1I2HQ09_9BURK|nr:hypothetical protein [Paracidovorax wautersii]SFF31638.1 hypothetical protein SAMN04489711_12713 [Paracidovorax wautersii]
MILRFPAAAALLLASTWSMAQMPVPLLSGSQTPPAFITERGAVVVKIEPGPGGMTAYTALKDGKPFVVFTTADRQVTMVGVLFDSKTGENLSDSYVDRANAMRVSGAASVPVVPRAAGTNATPGISAKEVFAGRAAHQPIAEMLFSSTVAGVVEGNGTPVNTAYVFFDPQCGYCHELYRRTRQVVKSGKSIKWIPVNVLGDKGIPLAAEVLRQGMPAMERLASSSLQASSAPTPLEREQIRNNTRFFNDIAHQAGKQMATPTTVFARPDSKFGVMQDDGSNAKAFAAAFGTGN